MIIENVLETKRNKEIAESLYISEDTVKKHRKNIYKKLGTNRLNTMITKFKDSSLFFLKRPSRIS